MLRPAISDDLRNIQSVLNDPDNLDKLEGYPDETILAAIKDGTSHIHIWEEAGQWCGFCWTRKHDRNTKIEEFGVSIPGQGIGSRFFQAVIDDFRSKNRDAHLWLVVAGDNIRAARFYHRFGFAQTNMRPAAWNRRKGPPADAIEMTLHP